MPRQQTSLTLADARNIVAAAEKSAQGLGIPCSVAAVDASGGLIAHARVDGAWPSSIDIAIHKAWTARAFDRSTEDFSSPAQPGKPAFCIQNTNHEKVVIFGGGAPVKDVGVVIGAVSVSGGTVDRDVKVVEAAVDSSTRNH